MILAHRLKVNQLMMTIQSLFCQTQLLRMRRTTLELYLNFTLFWSFCHSGCQHSQGPLLHHLQQQIIQFTRLVRSCIPNEVGAMVTMTLGLTTHSTQGLNWWQAFCSSTKWMVTRAGSIHLIKQHKLWERIHFGQPGGCMNGLMCLSGMRKICLLTNMADLHCLCLVTKIWGKRYVYTCNLRGNLSVQWTLYIFWTPLRWREG